MCNNNIRGNVKRARERERMCVSKRGINKTIIPNINGNIMLFNCAVMNNVAFSQHPNPRQAMSRKKFFEFVQCGR